MHWMALLFPLFIIAVGMLLVERPTHSPQRRWPKKESVPLVLLLVAAPTTAIAAPGMLLAAALPAWLAGILSWLAGAGPYIVTAVLSYFIPEGVKLVVRFFKLPRAVRELLARAEPYAVQAVERASQTPDQWDDVLSAAVLRAIRELRVAGVEVTPAVVQAVSAGIMKKAAKLATPKLSAAVRRRG